MALTQAPGRLLDIYPCEQLKHKEKGFSKKRSNSLAFMEDSQRKISEDSRCLPQHGTNDGKFAGQLNQKGQIMVI